MTSEKFKHMKQMNSKLYDNCCILTSLISLVVTSLLYSRLKHAPVVTLLLMSSCLASVLYRTSRRFNPRVYGTDNCPRKTVLFVLDVTLAIVAMTTLSLWTGNPCKQCTRCMAATMYMTWVFHFLSRPVTARLLQAGAHWTGVFILLRVLLSIHSSSSSRKE